jgi:hypothetical protein
MTMLLLIAVSLIAGGLMLPLGFFPIALILCGIALLVWFVNVDRT